MDPEFNPNAPDETANRLLTEQEFETLYALKQSQHHDTVMGLFQRIETELVRVQLPNANPSYLQVIQGQAMLLASIRYLFEMEDAQAVQSYTADSLFGGSYGATPEQLMG